MFQADAIARLLRDDDPTTIELVKAQLLASAGENVPHLRAMLTRPDDAVVTRHVRAVLSAIDAREANNEMDLLCRFFAEDGDIETACWMIARCLSPGIETDGAGRQLDQWGMELSRRIVGFVDDATRVAALRALLHDELGFTGNNDAYYAPDNSLLPRVIESRRGIPISLTLVYQGVARRAGLKVEGVNLPGHFIARLGEVLFDPFHNGRRLSAADCEAILLKQSLRPHPSHLSTASSRLVLVRSLANLHFIFQEMNQEAERDRIAGWLRALDR